MLRQYPFVNRRILFRIDLKFLLYFVEGFNWYGSDLESRMSDCRVIQNHSSRPVTLFSRKQTLVSTLKFE